MPDDIMLRVKGLKKYFPIRSGILQTIAGYVKAVDGVDLFIKEGETLGLVGESGCGKTTTGRCIIRLIEPTAGTIEFKSRILSQNGESSFVDLLKLGPAEMKVIRQEIAMIFQDPNSSLNPRMSVGDIVKEPLIIHGKAKGKEAEERVSQILEAVGLRPEHMRRYPHEFSGGQRQRIGIARALALNPRLIVCDEPVSALDVSIQGQVLNLLEELQRQFGLTYLFIAHDLSVVQHISNRVTVMYLGRVIELADTNELYSSPMHPYTEALLSAVPVPDPDYRRERILLKGNVPSPINPPTGCYFHPRCVYQEKLCGEEIPPLREIRPGHYVACHLAEELKLRGVEI